MTDSTHPPVIVYSFGAAWGFPALTPSPFGLKLVTWLRMNGVAHEIRVENNPGKGPKGKCPWAVIGDETIGDSELVIEKLKAQRGITGDAGLSAQQRAIATATRLMLEEHYHQVWEHELFIYEGGWKRGVEWFDQLPPVVRVLVRNIMRSQLRKQLYARGVGRHDHARIVAMGIQDLETVEALLGDGPFFFGDEPTEIDATVFGFLAVTHWTPVESPVWDHYHSRPRLTGYSERMLARYF
jgi:glutathione S-transferase